MKTEFYRWLLLAVVGMLVLGFTLSISMTGAPYGSDEDPFVLFRYVLLRLAAVAIAAPALTGLMLLVDFITPGDWMKAIGHDPKAACCVMSAVILVIGAILCWT
jgi:hypothetical protein